VGGTGYSLFSPDTTVEIKQEFKHKPSEGSERQADNKESDELTKKRMMNLPGI
jgi:hypothetical protein